jgi:hypothetical protein
MNDAILDKIVKNQKAIFAIIGNEGITIYNFLVCRFKAGNITKDYIFQFCFRSFYQLDSAGLTSEWKTEFFNILEANRNSEPINIDDIAKKLYAIETSRGRNSLQFSFITKLNNLVHPNEPIYDSKVAKVFGFVPPQNKDFEKKLNIYLEFYQKIKSTYDNLAKNEKMIEVLKNFDEEFPSNGLSKIKKIDFVIWALGNKKIV